MLGGRYVLEELDLGVAPGSCGPRDDAVVGGATVCAAIKRRARRRASGLETVFSNVCLEDTCSDDQFDVQMMR